MSIFIEMNIFPQAAHIDVHEVRIAAISAVVDLLMRHGLASFITTSNSAGEDLDNSGTGSEAAASRCADIADSLDFIPFFCIIYDLIFKVC